MLCEEYSFQVMASRRRVTNMLSGWRAPLMLHFCTLRKSSPHIVPFAFWGLSHIPSQHQHCRWEWGGKTENYSSDSRGESPPMSAKGVPVSPTWWWLPEEVVIRGGRTRMERLWSLEWREVGGMPASPRGLLSDRNMAGRLGLGNISEEDHCLRQGRSVHL